MSEVKCFFFLGIRSYAAAAGHSVSAHGDKAHVEHHHETDFKLPIATYDDLPIPRYPYQEMYNKENATFNMMLVAAFVVFVATAAYVSLSNLFFDSFSINVR